jgi:hypothetical protein
VDARSLEERVERGAGWFRAGAAFPDLAGESAADYRSAMPHELVLTAARVWIDDDGIARGEALPDSNETREGAKAMIEHLRRAGGGRRLRFLMDIRRGRSISRDARTYLGSEEVGTVVLAGALLVDSALSRGIGNFYLAINRPRWPVRLFTSETEALAWLRPFAEPAAASA